ncbi:hypothetical protein JCM10213_002475 [Rhodosporidiobolus nylandii]
MSRPVSAATPSPVYLHDYISSERFTAPNGRKDLRAWNAEHEALMLDFYAPTNPPLVPDPAEHVHHLTESAFASRRRGTAAVRAQAKGFAGLCYAKDFEEMYVKPWRALSQTRREECVLEALEINDDGRFREQRKLLPEITLEELCSGSGDGFVSLLRKLSYHCLDPDFLSHPIPHVSFHRMFGLDLGEKVPLGKADRAFQEEYVLIRHSRILGVCRDIIEAMRGELKPTRKIGLSGNVESEMNKENVVFCDDNTVFPDLRPERCNLCLKSAPDTPQGKLLFCEACKRVGRSETYCSTTCQRLHWPRHKTSGGCGKKVSEIHNVPLYTVNSDASASASSHLNPLRRFVLEVLDKETDEYWAVVVPPTYVVLGTCDADCEGKIDQSAKNVELRQAMRKVAYSALREGDETSIAILSVTVVKAFANIAYPDEAYRPSEEVSKHQLRRQFQEMFSLDDEQLRAAMKRGRKVVQEEGREKERMQYKIVQRTRLNRRVDQLFDHSDNTAGSPTYNLSPEEKEAKRTAMRWILLPLYELTLDPDGDDDEDFLED